MSTIREPYADELAVPVRFNDLGLVRRALQHELAMCEFALFAIHSTPTERRDAERDANRLRALLRLVDGHSS